MELSHNNSKRRRQVAKAESDGAVLADMNKGLQKYLDGLRLTVPLCEDAEEKRRGENMIYRLERELGSASNGTTQTQTTEA